MSHINNKTCALCLVDFELEDEVRTVEPNKGWVFPESHIWPDGKGMFGGRIPNACIDSESHLKEPHIHEKCIPQWEDKFNLRTPETREEALEMVSDLEGEDKELYDLW